MRRHVILYYDREDTENRGAAFYAARFENFVDLNLTIRSNSRRFLEMVKNEYKLFACSKVRAYYKSKFKNPMAACIDILFGRDSARILSVSHAGLEREIKRFLFERFLVFHASSVIYNGFNLFFMGDVKSGKSTTCAAMSDLGAAVLAEDYSIVKKDTREAVLFPTFIGNIRSGARSAIQKEYLGRFYKDGAAPLIQRMTRMKKEDLRTLFAYHKKLYGIDNGLLSRNPAKGRNVFIILVKDPNPGRGGTLTRIKSLDALPELLRHLSANRTYYGKAIKDSVSLFLKSECYVFKRAPLEVMVSAIRSRFG